MISHKTLERRIKKYKAGTPAYEHNPMKRILGSNGLKANLKNYLFNKNILRSLLVMGIIITAFMLVFLSIKPGIIGWATLRDDILYSDTIGLSLNQSINYSWYPEHKGIIGSFRLSGSISPDGYGKVYLSDGQNECLVFESSSINKPPSFENGAADKNIIINLSFKKGTIYDPDDDGIEDINGVVDVTVENTHFNAGLNNKYLCTRYEIYSLNKESSNLYCHGNKYCCEFLGISQKTDLWNEPFYISHAMGEYGLKKAVSAQVAYIKYNLSLENPYSEIHYSDWASLSVNFYDKLIEFEDAADENCILDLDGNEYILIIEVLNTTLVLDHINYTLVHEIKLDNMPPILLKNFSDIKLLDSETITIDLRQYFHDAGNLSFEFYNTTNIAVIIEDSKASITAKDGFVGSTYMFFVADNGYFKAVGNIFKITIGKDSKILAQGEAEIGKPVEWTLNSEEREIEIPETAYNIKVIKGREDAYLLPTQYKVNRKKKIRPGSVLLEIQDSYNSKLKTAGIDRAETAISNFSTQGYFIIKYKTDAPGVSEKELSPNRKIITVSSSMHYSDVLTYTLIQDSPREAIKVYWLKEGKRELFTNITYHDINRNGQIDKLEWIIPHLSNQTFEIEIKILNIQSYPIVGGNWSVEFRTFGTANLSISPINNTTYSEMFDDNASTADDLELLELRCGNSILFSRDGQSGISNLFFAGNDQSYKTVNLMNHTVKINSLFIKDFNCPGIAMLTVRVVSGGKHTQRFTFGDNAEYAHNLADSLFYSPRILSAPQASQNLTISIQNISVLSSPQINYKNIISDYWLSLDISSGNATIPAHDLKYEGIYEYFFNDSNGERFPTIGSFKISLSIGLSNIYEKASLLSVNDSSSGYFCQPNTPGSSVRYNCQIDSLQAHMISSFLDTYHMTRNQSFRNTAHILAASDFDNGAGEGDATCNQDKNDFNCGSQLNFQYPGTVSGARRQASLIYSLWDAYQKGGSDTLRNLAIQYSLGSAEGCDVWNSTPDYNCTSPDDQGFMILAYWKSYEMTGQNTYRNIAINLTEIGQEMNNSEYLILGFWKAYELTGNFTYYEKALGLTDELINKCRLTGCAPTIQAMNILAYWEAYEQTASYVYRRAAIEKTYTSPNSSCDPWSDDYRCANPEQQGLLSTSLWKAYQSALNSSPGFYAPKFLNVPKLDNDLNISISFSNNLTNPSIYYKKVSGPSWTKRNISLFNGTVTIPASDLAAQGIYEYFFNAGGGITFPEGNGTFKFALSEGISAIREKAEKIAGEDPYYFCDAFGTNDQYDNYSCRFEYMQAWMIKSFSDAYYSTGNQSYDKAALLSTAEIDKTPDMGLDKNGLFATCDHFSNDFECNFTNLNFPESAYKKTGAGRQASLIYSLWDAHQRGANETVRNLAIRYSLGSAEECDIWGTTPDYNCQAADDQGFMILAYWKAYEMTGENKYKTAAMNLTQFALDMNSSEYLILGFWKAYEMTGSLDYYNKAVDLTDELISVCTSSGCSAEKQAINILAYWTAYEQAADDSYLLAAIDKTLTQRSGKYCDPNDPGGTEYQCLLPNEQGMMSSAFWKAYSIYGLNVSQTVNITINTVDNVSISDQFNVSCTINNSGTTSRENLTIKLLLSSGLTTNENTSIYLSEIGAKEIYTLNWTINATEGGPQLLQCTVSSAAIFQTSNVHQVIVNNLGPVFSLNASIEGNITLYDETTLNLIIGNNISYDLYNVTLQIYALPCLNITAVSANKAYANISEDYRTLVFTQLSASENISINYTLFGIDIGMQIILVNVTSQYGGFDSINASTLVLGGQISMNLDTPNYQLINQSFNATLYLENIGPINITDGNLSISLTPGLNITDISINDSKANISQDYKQINLSFFARREKITIVWTMAGLADGLENISIDSYGGRDSFNVSAAVEIFYCGNGKCDGDESCNTCPEDCGQCASSPAGGTTGSGCGGGAFYKCIPNWSCGNWSECRPSGHKRRTCIDLRQCNSSLIEKTQYKKCKYEAAAGIISGIKGKDTNISNIDGSKNKTGEPKSEFAYNIVRTWMNAISKLSPVRMYDFIKNIFWLIPLAAVILLINAPKVYLQKLKRREADIYFNLRKSLYDIKQEEFKTAKGLISRAEEDYGKLKNQLGYKQVGKADKKLEYSLAVVKYNLAEGILKERYKKQIIDLRKDYREQCKKISSPPNKALDYSGTKIRKLVKSREKTTQRKSFSKNAEKKKKDERLVFLKSLYAKELDGLDNLKTLELNRLKKMREEFDKKNYLVKKTTSKKFIHDFASKISTSADRPHGLSNVQCLDEKDIYFLLKTAEYYIRKKDYINAKEMFSRAEDSYKKVKFSKRNIKTKELLNELFNKMRKELNDVNIS